MPPALLWGLLVVALVNFGVGLVLGLYLGERGRRLDLQWITGHSSRPDDPRAEVEASREGSADTRALRRAEIEAVEQALISDLQAQGRGGQYTPEQIREEAVRLVSFGNVDDPEL